MLVSPPFSLQLMSIGSVKMDPYVVSFLLLLLPLLSTIFWRSLPPAFPLRPRWTLWRSNNPAPLVQFLLLSKSHIASLFPVAPWKSPLIVALIESTADEPAPEVAKERLEAFWDIYGPFLPSPSKSGRDRIWGLLSSVKWDDYVSEMEATIPALVQDALKYWKYGSLESGVLFFNSACFAMTMALFFPDAAQGSAPAISQSHRKYSDLFRKHCPIELASSNASLLSPIPSSPSKKTRVAWKTLETIMSTLDSKCIIENWKGLPVKDLNILVMLLLTWVSAAIPTRLVLTLSLAKAGKGIDMDAQEALRLLQESGIHKYSIRKTLKSTIVNSYTIPRGYFILSIPPSDLKSPSTSIPQSEITTIIVTLLASEILATFDIGLDPTEKDLKIDTDLTEGREIVWADQLEHNGKVFEDIAERVLGVRRLVGGLWYHRKEYENEEEHVL